MATVKDVVNQAWRRSSVVAAGRTPSAVLFAVGKERLADIYTTLVGGLFGRFNDVCLAAGTDAYTANEWDRVYCTDAGTVVTLPQTVTDCDNGQTRTPLDYAPIHVVNSAADPQVMLTSVWDAFVGRWVPLEGWGDTDYAPFSGRYKDGLVCSLAMLLGDEGGYAPRPMVAKMATSFRMNLASRWDQKRVSLPGVYY